MENEHEGETYAAVYWDQAFELWDINENIRFDLTSK